MTPCCRGVTSVQYQRVSNDRNTIRSRFRDRLELIILTPRFLWLFTSLAWLAVFNRKALRELEDMGHL
jgi:hypothetical protein